MRNLMRLPAARRLKVTGQQLALMDLLALRDGLALGELGLGQRRALRNLIKREFVIWPAAGIYLLTPIGRLVRSRAR